MSPCNGNCNQGRACNCSVRMPAVPVHVVDRAYDDQPSPRVARWLDENPRLGTAALVMALLALFVLVAWPDGGAP